MKYLVTVVEEVVRKIEVEANSSSDAEKSVYENYCNGDYDEGNDYESNVEVFVSGGVDETTPRYVVEQTSDAWELPFIIRDTTYPEDADNLDKYYHSVGYYHTYESEIEAQSIADMLNKKDYSSQPKSDAAQVTILDFLSDSGVYKAQFAYKGQVHKCAIMRQNDTYYVSIGSVFKGDRERINLTGIQAAAFVEFVKVKNNN